MLKNDVSNFNQTIFSFKYFKNIPNAFVVYQYLFGKRFFASIRVWRIPNTFKNYFKSGCIQSINASWVCRFFKPKSIFFFISLCGQSRRTVETGKFDHKTEHILAYYIIFHVYRRRVFVGGRTYPNKFIRINTQLSFISFTWIIYKLSKVLSQKKKINSSRRVCWIKFFSNKTRVEILMYSGLSQACSFEVVVC